MIEIAKEKKKSKTCLYGEIFRERLIESAGHTAVLSGVDESAGAKQMVQQITGQRITLFTSEVQGSLENFHKLVFVGKKFLSIHSCYLQNNINHKHQHIFLYIHKLSFFFSILQHTTNLIELQILQIVHGPLGLAVDPGQSGKPNKSPASAEFSHHGVAEHP